MVIAGRPRAALLFWFFGDFRCGALLFMLWNQSTIISLDWLNTFRIYFRTNRSLVHW